MAAKAWQPSFLDEIVARGGTSPSTAGAATTPMLDFDGATQAPVIPPTHQVTIGDPQVQQPTDWSNLAGAGIGAAGATVGTLAQLAGQKAAWDQQAMQNDAYLGLSEKLAKMKLGQQQSQFDISQAFNALQWALQANKAYQNTGVGGRELRRTSSDLLGDALRRLYLPTRR